MIMATYCELTATLKFEDGQTKNVSFSPYYATDGAVTGFKTRAMAINDALDDGGDVFRVIALEDADSAGSEVLVTKISAATITATEKTVIFAKTESARANALEMAGDNNG